MKVIKLLAIAVGLLLLSETPSSAVAQTLTNSPTGTVYCNGTEVVFTCETRGSASLEWRGDDFYVGNDIRFVATVHPNNTVRTRSFNTVATLTLNSMDGDVGVLVSTLRIIATSNAPSGNVSCVLDNGAEERIDFHVLVPPAVPQGVISFQLEHVRDMCVIASVLPSPTNPAEADATTYTVSVDGGSVLYRNAELISTDGMRHSALLYESSCTTHRISISAINMCGDSPELQFMLDTTFSDSASNINCSVIAVIVSVVLVAFKSLLDLS